MEGRTILSIKDQSVVEMNNPVCQSVCPDVRNLSALNRHLMGSITVLIIPVAILANVTVLVGLIKTKSAGSRLFVIPLCINDLIIGLVSQPLTALYVFHVKAANYCYFRYIIQFLSYGLLGLEFFLISAMGIERLIILKYQMQEIRFRWEAVRKYVLVFSIFLALAFGTMSILISLYTTHFYIFSFWLLVAMLILTVVTTGCYIVALQYVQMSVQKLYDRKDSNVIVNRNRKKLRHDMALGRSVKLIICAEMLAVSPYFFIALVWSWQMAANSVTPIVEGLLTWSFIPFYLNTIVNVFLYSYHNRPLKKYILKRWHSLLSMRVPTVASEPPQAQVKTVGFDTKL